MKLRLGWILPLLVCSLLAGLPALAQNGQGTTLIHIVKGKQASPVRYGERCWEPEATFATTIDTGYFVQLDTAVAAKTGATPMVPRHNPNSSLAPTVANWLMNQGPVRQFALVQALLVSMLVYIISVVLLMHAQYIYDIHSKRAKGAVFGYVLSLDLGFILLTCQGFGKPARMFGSFDYSGIWSGWSPDMVIFILVACAWIRFLKQNPSGKVLINGQQTVINGQRTA